MHIMYCRNLFMHHDDIFVIWPTPIPHNSLGSLYINFPLPYSINTKAQHIIGLLIFLTLLCATLTTAFNVTFLSN